MKRKWWFAEILLGVYLAVAVFSVGWSVSFISRHPAPVCETSDTNQQTEKCGDQNPVSPIEGLLLWIDADKVIAFFTIILGIGTIYLVRDGRAHSRHQLRAYVFPADMGIVDLGTPPTRTNLGQYGFFHFRIALRNSGQTPAYDVRNWFDVKVMEVSPQNEANLTIGSVGDSASVPPGAANLADYWSKSRLSDEQIDAIRAGTIAVYIWGRTEYRDAFKRHRYTNYRLRFTGQYPPEQGALIAYCNGGNETDEDASKR